MGEERNKNLKKIRNAPNETKVILSFSYISTDGC